MGVGTELLLGQIANTNAKRISEALNSIGMDVLFHTAVGDNHERIVSVLRVALERSEVVVVTGGLGPTPDDITAEAIAAVTDRLLERDPKIVEFLRSFFERRGREMPEENLKQADRPEGAIVIDPEGTAPGFYLEHEGALLFALPGVPWEMEAMLTKTILPVLRDRGEDAVVLSREIMVVGLGESHTHEKIADIVAAQSNPTIAYLAGGGRVRVRLTAKASSEADALALITPIEDEIRNRLGEDAVPGHHASLAEALGDLLRGKGAKVAVAESLTGGLIATQLTDCRGASDFFAGSLVVYATESKRDVAGVDEAVLAGPGPVSVEAAAQLAAGAARRFDADLGLGATGIAGPAEQDGMPVGTIFVGATWGGRTEVRSVRGYGDRSNVREIAATAALDLGRRIVSG